MMNFMKRPVWLAIVLMLMTRAYAQVDYKLDFMKYNDGNSNILPNSSMRMGLPQCYSLTPQFGTTGLSFLTSDLKDITFKASQDYCTKARVSYLNYYERFSKNRCDAAFYCTYGKINGIEDQKKKENAQVILRFMAAKTLIDGHLRLKISDMEKIEILKRFAEKKYGSKIGATCADRFSAQSGPNCRLSMLEKSFIGNQEKCSGKVGCFNTNDEYNYLKYAKDFKNNDQSVMLSYFDNLAEKKATTSFGKDEEYVEKIANLISSSEFNNASVATKEEMFINAVNSADPILSMDFEIVGNNIDSVKEKSQFKSLKSLFLKKGISKKDFISQFEGFRKKRAEALLAGPENQCAKLPTMQSICADSTKLIRGEKIENIDGNTLASQLNQQSYDKDSKGYKALKGIMGENLEDEYDLELYLDAQRCVAFNLSGVEKREADLGRIKDIEERDHEIKAREEAMISFFSNDSSSSRAGDKYDTRPGEASIDDTLASLGLKERSSDTPKAVVRAELDTGELTKDAASIESREGPYAGNNYYNPSSFNNNLFPQRDFSDESNKGTLKDSVSPHETAKTDTVSSSVNEDKLSELMKKLSATEDKLDKLKAANEEAEESRQKEKKIQEENDVIADLKAQINELKNRSTKATVSPAAASSAQESRRVPSASSNTSFGSAATRSAEVKNSHVEIYEQTRLKPDSAAPVSSSGSSAQAASRSVASAPMLSSTLAESSGASGNLVLTKVDGMSSEKAAETISSRIRELNGVPFLIEEDGVTKKVIPLIKDGKIDLDENGRPKYVKIKVNRKECTEEEKTKGKCRAPASIVKVNTAVADEKREQEEKTRKELERAQYLKLKALSKKALDKK